MNCGDVGAAVDSIPQVFLVPGFLPGLDLRILPVASTEKAGVSSLLIAPGTLEDRTCGRISL